MLESMLCLMFTLYEDKQLDLYKRFISSPFNTSIEEHPFSVNKAVYDHFEKSADFVFRLYKDQVKVTLSQLFQRDNYDSKNEDLHKHYSLFREGDLVITKHTNFGPFNTFLQCLIHQKEKANMNSYLREIKKCIFLANKFAISPLYIDLSTILPLSQNKNTDTFLRLVKSSLFDIALTRHQQLKTIVFIVPFKGISQQESDTSTYKTFTFALKESFQ